MWICTWPDFALLPGYVLIKVKPRFVIIINRIEQLYSISFDESRNHQHQIQFSDSLMGIGVRHLYLWRKLENVAAASGQLQGFLQSTKLVDQFISCPVHFLSYGNGYEPWKSPFCIHDIRIPSLNLFLYQYKGCKIKFNSVNTLLLGKNHHTNWYDQQTDDAALKWTGLRNHDDTHPLPTAHKSYIH